MVAPSYECADFQEAPPVPKSAPNGSGVGRQAVPLPEDLFSELGPSQEGQQDNWGEFGSAGANGAPATVPQPQFEEPDSAAPALVKGSLAWYYCGRGQQWLEARVGDVLPPAPVSTAHLAGSGLFVGVQDC